MNLYLLTQEENNDYDTYDSCVVVAESEEEAKKYNPYGNYYNADDKYWSGGFGQDWASKPENVEAKLIGYALNSAKAGEVILSSFNAG